MTDFEPATLRSLSEAGIVDYSTASQASRPSQPLIIKALADPWPIVCPPLRSGVLLLFVVWPLPGYHQACSLANYCSISVVSPPPPPPPPVIEQRAVWPLSQFSALLFFPLVPGLQPARSPVFINCCLCSLWPLVLLVASVYSIVLLQCVTHVM